MGKEQQQQQRAGGNGNQGRRATYLLNRTRCERRGILQVSRELRGCRSRYSWRGGGP